MFNDKSPNGIYVFLCPYRCVMILLGPYISNNDVYNQCIESNIKTFGSLPLRYACVCLYGA